MATKNARNQSAKKKSAPRPIFIINRSNLLGWILAAVLGWALMFVLGILVGRDQAPVHFDIKRLDEKLPKLKQSVLTAKAKPVDAIENLKNDGVPGVQGGEPHTVAPKYDKKHMTENAVPPEALRPKPDETEDETHPARAEVEETASNRTVSGSPQAETSKTETHTAPEPTTDKKSSVAQRRDRPAAETVSTGHPGVDGYAIQIASMQDPESAALVRDRFLAKGYPAYCQKADVNGKTWHRVRIGPYPNKDKARQDLKSLTDAGVSAMIFLAEGARP